MVVKGRFPINVSSVFGFLAIKVLKHLSGNVQYAPNLQSALVSCDIFLSVNNLRHNQIQTNIEGWRENQKGLLNNFYHNS